METGVVISHLDCLILIRVIGRANFDYAVPLRDLAKEISGQEVLCFDLSACTAMDSTFMGVMSMLGLKTRKAGGKVEVAGAGGNLLGLLSELGIDKLFSFTDYVPAGAEGTRAACPVNLVDRAETVLEAHQTLAEVDESNAEKFEHVIKFAKDDVDRLKQDDGKA